MQEVDDAARVQDNPQHKQAPDGAARAATPRTIATIADPRRSDSGAAGTVGVIAFYHPGKDTEWDERCGCGFLGNFADLERLGGLALTATAPGGEGRTHHFRTSETAYQALKFWDRAAKFEPLDADAAFRLKGSAGFKGNEDWTMGGYGSRWQAMVAVLCGKFAMGSELADMLLATGDAFLLEHNSVHGRDTTWSNNAVGDGKNWLGMALMVVRDRLRGDDMEGVRGEGPDTWSQWLVSECGIDPGAGPGSGKTSDHPVWQAVVLAATEATIESLKEAVAGWMSTPPRQPQPPPPT